MSSLKSDFMSDFMSSLKSDGNNSSIEKNTHHPFDDQKTKNRSRSANSINIGLGQVYAYYSQNGFGFVSNILDNNDDGVFFHINNLKNSTPKLSSSVEDYGFRNRTGRKKRHYYSEIEIDLTEAPYLWYEFEYSDKGKRVNLVLSRNILSKQYKNYLPEIIKKMEDVWKILTFPIQEYFQKECKALLGLDRVNELREKRRALINQTEECINEMSQLGDVELQKRIEQGELDGFFSESGDDTPIDLKIAIFKISIQVTLKNIKREKQIYID